MNLDPDAQADVMVQMAAQEDEEEEDGDQTPMEMGLSAEVIEEINRKKKAMPNMFVSGFEADDDGVEKNVDDPVEEFLTAAEEGDVMKVKSMMEGASAKGELRELFAMHDDDGYTALHRSAYNDHREVVKMLLEAGEDPMAVTNDGWTPLHTAAYWANPQIVGLLLSTGKVDVNARTNGGLVPLHLAINANSERSPDDVLETVQYLLAAPGVNASARNGAGDTPFALARRSSRQLTEMVERFLKRL
ncbi:hypothetical protein QR680_016765 [Steinernema hermaphroditum]|uniref:Uncharacterized protein n=1 Tax=Steinernema hermaphroditum TaxID=289476 RepID=A0AA39HCP0_9BILA|nr:hypothetical protein QR680_016765 [Steinernema hermaphroditum]